MPKSESPPTETCNAINKSGKNKDKQCHYPSKHSITYNGTKYKVCGRHKKATNFICKPVDDTEEIIKRNPNADIEDVSDSEDEDNDSLKVGKEYVRMEFYDCETDEKISDKGKIITSHLDDKKYYLDETTDYVYNQDIVINKTKSEKVIEGDYLGTLTEVNDEKAPIHYYDRYWIIASDFIIDYRKKAYIRCVLTNRAYYHKNGIYRFYGNATPKKKGGFTIKKTITESQK